MRMTICNKCTKFCHYVPLGVSIFPLCDGYIHAYQCYAAVASARANVEHWQKHIFMLLIQKSFALCDSLYRYIYADTNNIITRRAVAFDVI